ncbi:hypothetical protein ACFQ14_01765 [Pseudahrensia aquimaris]|uniref:Uncharacterized protein n=1 Tax=Pseudahrensia aquimaris TaxID=744461 RepID=A0ABW3FB66_9HYPH
MVFDLNKRPLAAFALLILSALMCVEMVARIAPYHAAALGVSVLTMLMILVVVLPVAGLVRTQR